MNVRNAVVTGLAGLMLSTGVGVGTASAQTYRRYDSWRARRYNQYYNNGMYYNDSTWGRAQSTVAQAYRDILGREPDPSGLQQYTDAMVNRGWSAAQVRQSLLQSNEYAQRFGNYRAYNRNYWRYR
jgi:uncharacterized protein DUF4214